MYCLLVCTAISLIPPARKQEGDGVSQRGAGLVRTLECLLTKVSLG